MTRVAIAADHNGVFLKAHLVAWLEAHGHIADDLGTNGTEVVDYPALCVAVGTRVAEHDADLGVVVGGSGQGEVVACNKVKGIRAGLAYSRFAVEISRGNNDANVMVIGTKVVTDQEAVDLLALWLSTPFKGGVHQQRVDQVNRLDDAR